MEYPQIECGGGRYPRRMLVEMPQHIYSVVVRVTV